MTSTLPSSDCQSGLRRHIRFILPSIVLTVLLLAVVLAWPVLAAVQLEFFSGLSAENELVLEWATVRESNLSGWTIYCKELQEPPAAYHLIGSLDAIGVGGNGGYYSFAVPDLTPGVPYCFRITEITADGSPGQSFDICGWGYAVTPTPGPTPTPTLLPGVVSSELVVQGNQPIVGDGLAPSPGVPTSTPTPVGQSPLAASGATATATPVSESPPSYTDGGATEQRTGSEEGTEDALAANNAGPAADAAGALPDPGYIVLTATPTTEALALLPPTFTPLPTVTSQPAGQIVDIAAWDTDNLVLAVLCFVFVGAGGLGILGITSLGFFVRSRAERRNARR